MIISFDIDNTLVPYSDEFEVEERKLLSRMMGAERIRKGTIELWVKLQNKGHEIWIYTTSNRSVFSLKKTFRSYGLTPTKFINGKINQETLRRNNCQASKNPKLFGIDVHIDDSKGVEVEGEQFGFRTIIIDVSDKAWVEKVVERIYAIETC